MAESIAQEEIKVDLNLTFNVKAKNTLEALKEASEGENYEYTSLYPEFAKIAREEGFEDIAKRIEAIALAEFHHEERYKKLLNLLQNGNFFKRDKKIRWICLKCGYVHEGYEPPKACPSCNHPQRYFAPKDLNMVC